MPTGSQRVFTDEDLEQFKKGEMSYTTFEAKTGALIDRLEAAERVISAQLLVCQDHREDEEYSDEIETKAEQAYDTWISTAGKSPVVRDPI